MLKDGNLSNSLKHFFGCLECFKTFYFNFMLRSMIFFCSVIPGELKSSKAYSKEPNKLWGHELEPFWIAKNIKNVSIMSVHSHFQKFKGTNWLRLFSPFPKNHRSYCLSENQFAVSACNQFHQFQFQLFLILMISRH